MVMTSGRISKKSDSELLASYIDTGRMDYFGVLYDRYIPLVYGLCLKYLGSVAEAEDAVMNIFEQVAAKVARSEVREFRTWIYTVARNHCFQVLRKKKVEVPTDDVPAVVEFDALVHLLDKGDDEMLLAALAKCLEQLPEPQRRSITLFFMEEKSYADISDITDYNLKSVKSYIQNGKRNLKNCMEANGATA